MSRSDIFADMFHLGTDVKVKEVQMEISAFLNSVIVSNCFANCLQDNYLMQKCEELSETERKGCDDMLFIKSLIRKCDGHDRPHIF